MSIAPIVDRAYRLQPSDLRNRSVTVTVSNVTLQGLERLQPVLHFTNLAKPLPLDDGQCDAMARITGQAILEAWVGRRLTLTPIMEAGRPTIRIDAPAAGSLDSPAPPVIRPARGAAWRPILLLLALLLTFAAVYLVENSSQIWPELQRTLGALR